MTISFLLIAGLLTAPARSQIRPAAPPAPFSVSARFPVREAASWTLMFLRGSLATTPLSLPTAAVDAPPSAPPAPLDPRTLAPLFHALEAAGFTPEKLAHAKGGAAKALEAAAQSAREQVQAAVAEHLSRRAEGALGDDYQDALELSSLSPYMTEEQSAQVEELRQNAVHHRIARVIETQPVLAVALGDADLSSPHRMSVLLHNVGDVMEVRPEDKLAEAEVEAAVSRLRGPDPARAAEDVARAALRTRSLPVQQAAISGLEERLADQKTGWTGRFVLRHSDLSKKQEVAVVRAIARIAEATNHIPLQRQALLAVMSLDRMDTAPDRMVAAFDIGRAGADSSRGLSANLIIREAAEYHQRGRRSGRDEVERIKERALDFFRIKIEETSSLQEWLPDKPRYGKSRGERWASILSWSGLAAALGAVSLQAAALFPAVLGWALSVIELFGGLTTGVLGLGALSVTLILGRWTMDLFGLRRW